MSERPITRRRALAAAGAALAAPFVLRPALAGPETVIRMLSDARGAHVVFDPLGVHVAPGTTVRWVIEANVHTATAYHPDNGGYSLRIPEGAEPWDSGHLVEPGASFAVTLGVPGVYDYLCRPHEHAGMVGRIVVGTPGGPGARPFDWFETLDPRPDWRPVPEAARAAFPAVEEIVRLGAVPAA